MPAQTHGRVRNGFNIQPRAKVISKNLKKPPCNNNSKCETAHACGKPLQPLKMRPSGLTRFRVSSGCHNSKKSSNVVIGRSAAAKRAINKRVCCDKHN